DQTTSTIKKVDSLKNYFLDSSPEDACWGLYLISGNKIPTKINRTFQQETFCEFIRMPMWLFKESAYHVGDGSETIALLRGPIENPAKPPRLGEFIEKELLTLKTLDPQDVKEKL